MSVTFRAFDPADALAIRLQPSQLVELGLSRSIENDGDALSLAGVGPAWSAIAGDGRVLACAGFAETFPPVQATAWALLAEGLGPDHLAITRYARARVREARYRRIELIASAAQARACRWAEMLGFTRVPHPLRNFGAASETCILFERIQ